MVGEEENNGRRVPKDFLREFIRPFNASFNQGFDESVRENEESDKFWRQIKSIVVEENKVIVTTKGEGAIVSVDPPSPGFGATGG